MGKKKTLNLSSLLKNTELKYSSSWPWPYCHQPKTLSFRAHNKDNTFKTAINSPFNDESKKGGDSIDDTVIRGLQSDRFFFEPDKTNSILNANKGLTTENENTQSLLPFKDSVVLSMESQDPYVDFRKSMEEMVEAHEVKNWECLQELLCWYLKVNDKTNHGYIVGAFVDLLVGIAFASSSFSSSSSSSSSSHSPSPSSPLSFFSSSLSSSYSTRCITCLEAHNEEVDTPSSSLLLEQVQEENDDEYEVETSKIEPSASYLSSNTLI